MPDTKSTDSPTAIITGAGGGVGQAAASLLAAAGYRLFLTSRTPEKLAATAGLIAREAPSATVQTHAADLTDPRQAAALVNACNDKLGRIDALVCVAGYAPLGSAGQITPDAWQKTLDANTSYVVHMTAAAWPIWRKQKSGTLAAVSSMASIDPFPGFAMYAPAKAALNLFIRCVADEGKRFNLKAVATAPGAIETPMLRENFSEKMIPADATLDPYEVAGLLIDCVTGKRDFNSGETIAQPNA